MSSQYGREGRGGGDRARRLAEVHSGEKAVAPLAARAALRQQARERRAPAGPRARRGEAERGRCYGVEARVVARRRERDIAARQQPHHRACERCKPTRANHLVRVPPAEAGPSDAERQPLRARCLRRRRHLRRGLPPPPPPPYCCPYPCPYCTLPPSLAHLSAAAERAMVFATTAITAGGLAGPACARVRLVREEGRGVSS